jgi:hypothetical protein
LQRFIGLLQVASSIKKQLAFAIISWLFMKSNKLKSRCPIIFALKVYGGKRTFLMIRAIFLAGKRSYGGVVRRSW